MVRRLAQLGCSADELQLILRHLQDHYEAGERRIRKLTELAEFAVAIGAPAARDYFRAIRETGAVAELTDDRLLAFARSVDPHTAEWYFWAIWGTRAVTELTSERVLQAIQFFRSINSPATVEYFLAIRETKALAELTQERVLAFARTIGSDAAVDYFGACWETDAVGVLTDARVIEFAESVGGDAAVEFFRAIRETRSVELLTKPAVLLFSELIGPAAARAYFQVLASTRAVGPLTTEGLLGASAVVRSIGAEAALDYFMAAAAARVEPGPIAVASDPGGTGASVPVLNLLDLPSYDAYRAVGLLGVTAAFWFCAWPFVRGSALTSQGLVPIGLVVVGWAAVLGLSYVLLATIVQRLAEQFLDRRRRLLNEHGIRWHDCQQGDRTCPLCWSSGRAHEDEQFDLARFCRCPAC